MSSAGEKGTPQTRIVHVNAASRSYDVHVGAGILGEVGAITRYVAGGSRCCVISDSNVAPLYLDEVLASLEEAGYEASSVVFPAGEANKNFSTLSDLLEGIAGHELTRDDVIVALGGGVTGDMGGLAAAMYLRGCKVIQVPTSLLAMVDSSVGGKCAVDLSAGKNLAGVFFQPHAVVADVRCLATISHELLTDSCGEVVKHAVLADPDMLEELTESPLNAPDVTQERLVDIVSRNVRIKRDVVNADEREKGLRQTLNLGHTIGHAIEAASDFRLGHGSCVAAGLCCVARASERKGWCDAATRDSIVACVEAHDLPTGTDLTPDEIMRYLVHDKKRHGNTVNLVVAEHVGQVALRTLSIEELREVVVLGCAR